MATSNNAQYCPKLVEMAPGEVNVCFGYELMFPNQVVPLAVKNAVKHLAEVFNNIQIVQLFLETSVNCPDLPAIRTRHSLQSWMFTIMCAKCKSTDNVNECHALL